jgi:hypothetical protein
MAGTGAFLVIVADINGRSLSAQGAGKELFEIREGILAL